MTEFEAACERFAADLCTAGATPAEVHRLRALYAAALAGRSDRAWSCFYAAVLDALAVIEPGGAEALAAYRRLAALADDDLGATLLTPHVAERMRSRLVEAA
jgi:hypothetical protein